MGKMSIWSMVYQRHWVYTSPARFFWPLQHIVRTVQQFIFATNRLKPVNNQKYIHVCIIGLMANNCSNYRKRISLFLFFYINYISNTQVHISFNFLIVQHIIWNVIVEFETLVYHCCCHFHIIWICSWKVSIQRIINIKSFWKSCSINLWSVPFFVQLYIDKMRIVRNGMSLKSKLYNCQHRLVHLKCIATIFKPSISALFSSSRDGVSIAYQPDSNLFKHFFAGTCVIQFPPGKRGSLPPSTKCLSAWIVLYLLIRSISTFLRLVCPTIPLKMRWTISFTPTDVLTRVAKFFASSGKWIFRWRFGRLWNSSGNT